MSLLVNPIQNKKNSPQSVNCAPSAIILFLLFQIQTVWIIIELLSLLYRIIIPTVLNYYPYCLLSLLLLLPFLLFTSQSAELVLYYCFQGSQIPYSLNSGSNSQCSSSWCHGCIQYHRLLPPGHTLLLGPWLCTRVCVHVCVCVCLYGCRCVPSHILFFNILCSFFHIQPLLLPVLYVLFPGALVCFFVFCFTLEDSWLTVLFQGRSRAAQPHSHSPPNSPPPSLPQGIERCSLCCTVGPCRLSVLNMALCTCPSPNP